MKAVGIAESSGAVSFLSMAFFLATFTKREFLKILDGLLGSVIASQRPEPCGLPRCFPVMKTLAVCRGLDLIAVLAPSLPRKVEPDALVAEDLLRSGRAGNPEVSVLVFEGLLLTGGLSGKTCAVLRFSRFVGGLSPPATFPGVLCSCEGREVPVYAVPW